MIGPILYTLLIIMSCDIYISKTFLETVIFFNSVSYVSFVLKQLPKGIDFKYTIMFILHK